MSDTQQAPNAASDVEMSQYVADRQRVDEEKLKKDDEIIQQFGDYTYGWHDSDAAGEAAKRGIDEQVVRDISADKGEPQWMLDMRLRGFKAFLEKPMPDWGGFFLCSCWLVQRKILCSVVIEFLKCQSHYLMLIKFQHGYQKRN